MTNKSNTQKTYTEEFKRDAVRLAGERGNIAAVARDLGIDASNLRKWIRLVKEEGERPFMSSSSLRAFAAALTALRA